MWNEDFKIEDVESTGMKMGTNGMWRSLESRKVGIQCVITNTKFLLKNDKESSN